MQHGDYTSPPIYPPQSYQPSPPPPAQPPLNASAPPYNAPDYSFHSQTYPAFPHTISDPTPPPTAPPPHYTPPQPTPPDSHLLHSSQPQNYPTYDPNYPSPNDPPLTASSSYPNLNSSPDEKLFNDSPNYDHGHGYLGDKLSGYGNFGINRSNSVGGYDFRDPNPNPSAALNGQLYDNAPKHGNGQGYFEENLGGYGSYGSSRSGLGGGFDLKEYKDDGVYAYEGKIEPYGARGTATSKPSNWSGLFDDYGRAITFPKEEKGKSGGSAGLKVVRAVPKAEDKMDVKGGVQKFRVKLLPESGGQSVMDVLCMVGLDGIRMLDPNTSRTLRIYPLETVTRCDKVDSSTFAFWSKTSIDVEARRIRLQSNSYATNTILDMVTAATVQFKEMGGRARPSDLPKAVEQSGEKKKGLTDWISNLKPVNEEKDHWGLSAQPACLSGREWFAVI